MMKVLQVNKKIGCYYSFKKAELNKMLVRKCNSPAETSNVVDAVIAQCELCADNVD